MSVKIKQQELIKKYEKWNKYWKDRNEKLFLTGETNILNYADKLKKEYTRAIKTINNEIYKFYGKYARDNKITVQELHKLLNKDELKDFKSELNDMADYMKNNFTDKDYMKQIKLLRLRTKVSRLDELKTNIQFEIEKLNNTVNNSMQDELGKIYEDGYYRTIFNNQQFFGFQTSFAILNKKAIEKAITTPYMTESYNDTLWRNKQQLVNILNRQIPQGIILGYNPNKLAGITTKQLGAKYTSVVRLIRTEYNLILNDSMSAGYKECGIEKYQILATLDSRTSEICRDWDGEIVDLKYKEVGVNHPPFHPNCRTTTIPYFEPDEFDTEIEKYIKDEKGIKHKIESDVDYLEWKNALKKNKDGTQIYENDVF